MAFGSPSAGAGSAPILRRGLISCLHSSSCCRTDDAPALSDQDLRQATLRLILGFYDEAFDRLPCQTMPGLGHLLDTAGGLCLGFLDPVSNIILNTVALLPHDAAPPAAKRSKRSWQLGAAWSYSSLLDFLTSYFGCLTTEQAVRYLYWARADLPLAVMLVQHDLYQQPEVLDPASPRTQAALKWAASEANHPAPDTLVQVMTIRNHAHAFALLKKQLQFAAGVPPLTSQDVGAIHRLLHSRQGHRDLADITTTSVDVSPEGSTITTTTTTVRRAVGRITSLRPTHDMVDKLSSCLTEGYDQKHTLKAPLCCGRDACDYTQSLNMYLHGMIHDFYIKSIMLLLPTPSGSLMRSILMAGHCYGSMDPVSNIIVNSIWHSQRGCPLPESDRNQIEHCTDILDPLSLLRAQVHSLKGLIKLAAFAADTQSSMSASALENLCSAKCDIVNMSSSSSSTQRFENKNPFHEAFMAAGHPLPLHLGELHRQLLLMPAEKSKLLSLLTEAQTSSAALPVDEIVSILVTVLNASKAPTLVLVQAPKLCAEALRVVSRQRSHYESRRSFCRAQIEQVLREYSSQRFWEQKYSLDFIIGVEENTKTSVFTRCHHVNFVATCDLQLQKTLFFAELWYTDEPKKNFCCPLPYPYAGRCYYDVHTARKIVYPDRAEYIEHDITRDGTGSVGDILEMDLVLMSSERDVQLAKDLNKRNAPR